MGYKLPPLPPLGRAAGGKWIQGAIKRPGAFTAKAKAAGKNVGQYAKDVLAPGSRASTRTKRQAVLAQTLRKLARRRRR